MMPRVWLALIALLVCTAQAQPPAPYPYERPYTIPAPPGFPDRVLFGPGTIALSPGSQMIIRRWAAFFAEHPHAAVIEGHADDPGDDDANLALAARRAEMVREALIALGVPATNLRPRAFGNTRPIAHGGDLAARAENRRVVVTFPTAPR
ncbi:MAG: OmpA family protein [Proteobacteria bacterium]|nr:OmpA family protein [Pseudomonadota bacterium]